MKNIPKREAKILGLKKYVPIEPCIKRAIQYLEKYSVDPNEK